MPIWDDFPIHILPVSLTPTGDDAPPRPEDCPHPDEPFTLSGLKRWTVDLCPQVLCGLVNRPEEHVFPFMTAGATSGDMSPATLHGARAEWSPAGNADEPCKRHYGRVTVAPDGDARFFMCTDYTEGPGPETHELLPFVRFQLDLMGPLVDPGDMGMLTTLRAPDWNEVILLSHAERCGGIPA